MYEWTNLGTVKETYIISRLTHGMKFELEILGLGLKLES